MTIQKAPPADIDLISFPLAFDMDKTECSAKHSADIEIQLEVLGPKTILPDNLFSFFRRILFPVIVKLKSAGHNDLYLGINNISILLDSPIRQCILCLQPDYASTQSRVILISAKTRWLNLLGNCDHGGPLEE